MYYDLILWDDEDDEQGNIRHMAEHAVTPEEFADVLDSVREEEVDRSNSSIHQTIIGETPDGRVLRIVFDVEEEDGFVTVTPITAYEPTELEP
jgi:hypothetical protein